MNSSSLIVAVLGLLCYGLGGHCMRQPVTDPTLSNLKDEVKNALNTKLLAELTAANDTINANSDAVSACLTSIESQQASCVQCVNTSCQARVTALGCTDVKPTPQQSCSPKALCDVVGVVNSAKAGVIVIGDAVEKIGKKAVEAIKKVAETVITTVEKGFVDAGKAIQGVAEKVGQGVAGTVDKVVSGIEDAAKEVAKGVNTAINEAGKVINKIGDGIKDGINAIKDVVGRRKRRQASEPVCDDFATNELACLYYQASCDSCKPLDSTDTDTVIKNVCGEADLSKYQAVTAAVSRIDPIIEVATNFSLVSVEFDPSSWQKDGYADVLVTYAMVIADVTFQTTSTVNVWVPATAAPTIAEEVFSRELP